MVPTMMLYELPGRSLDPNHGDQRFVFGMFCSAISAMTIDLCVQSIEGLLLPSYSKGL